MTNYLFGAAKPLDLKKCGSIRLASESPFASKAERYEVGCFAQDEQFFSWDEVWWRTPGTVRGVEIAFPKMAQHRTFGLEHRINRIDDRRAERASFFLWGEPGQRVVGFLALRGQFRMRSGFLYGVGLLFQNGTTRYFRTGTPDQSH
jgi:hypothetical protein